MPNRLYRWTRSAASLAAIALLTAALLEGVLRLSVGDVYTTLYRADSQRHYRLAPGSQKLFQHPKAHGGGRIRVAINQQGFRGDELLPSGAAKRIVVYGDSFIAAEFSALEHSYTEQLENELTRRLAEPVEVVNAGVPGYGPDQSLLRMSEDLATLSPDLVVQAVYVGNDFGDLLRNKLFRVDETGALRETPGQVVGATATRLRWSRYTPVLYKVVAKAYYAWSRKPAAASDPVEARPRQIDGWLQERQDEWQSFSSGDLGVSNLLRDTPDLDISTAPDSASARDKLRLMEALLAATRDTLAGAGVPLLLVIIPSPMDVCAGYPLTHVDPARFPDYRPERATQLLSDMAERLGISQLDLYPLFQQNAPCTLFFPDDPHWNDKGQALAARLTAEAIAEAIVKAEPLAPKAAGDDSDV